MIGHVRNAAMIILVSMCITQGHQFRKVFRVTQSPHTQSPQMKWQPADIHEKKAYDAYKKQAKHQNLFNAKPVFRHNEFKVKPYNNTFKEILIKPEDMEQHGEVPIFD